MYIFIEEYTYTTPEALKILTNLGVSDIEDSIRIKYVGYFYSKELNDNVFFLPKVVIDKNNHLLGNPQYDIEQLIDITKAKEDGKISYEDYMFIYSFSIWVYRAINEYFLMQNEGTIVHKKEISYDCNNGSISNNSYLDIILALEQFNRENEDFFTYTIRNIHSRKNKINWKRTFSQCCTVIQDENIFYLDSINKKKDINFDEELLIIYFSILQYITKTYGIPTSINYNYPLLSEDEFNNYLKGYGTIKLEGIRNKYFSDKLILLWTLCYDFFSKNSAISIYNDREEFLIASDFEIIFEKMIDTLIKDSDSLIDEMKLKEQKDNKRVDHIFAYDSLIYCNSDIYYIGDSKYYKLGNNLNEDSIYKQYTYARNVIQANLDLYNTIKKSGSNEKYKKYLDPHTEGYNITPNFFIRAYIPNDKNYSSDGLELFKEEPTNRHFNNRLFDRDTLLLQHYNINFLYVLAVFSRNNFSEQLYFKKKVRKIFNEKIKLEISNKYKFYCIQYKKTSLNDFHYLIENKYFRSILGKAFCPFDDELFFYLALENSSEFTYENTQLLHELDKEFYILDYELGSDPHDILK